MLVWRVKVSAPMWQTKQAELQFGGIVPNLVFRPPVLPVVQDNHRPRTI
jgi:hypothetical protein